MNGGLKVFKIKEYGKFPSYKTWNDCQGVSRTRRRYGVQEPFSSVQNPYDTKWFEINGGGDLKVVE